MLSWNIVIGLLLIAFILPFLFLRSQLESTQRHVRSKHAELEHLRRHLRDLEQHVRNDQSLFLEALGVPFLLLRPSGRLVMSNRAAEQLLGLPPQSGVNLLHSLCSGSPLRPVIEHALASAPRYSGKLEVKLCGEERFFRIVSTRLNGREEHIGLVFHDVTEEHRTQIIRRDFVANASHELRTPLTIIKGYIETMLEEPDTAADEAMRTRALTVMKKHAERIVRLIEDMLCVSKLESMDKDIFKMEDFDLAELLEDVRLRLDSMARRQGAEISVRLQPEPFPMHGDKFYWSQILFNLMENALKNNPQSGLQIAVSAAMDAQGQPRIVVEDDGVGIRAEALPFIFNRFYRADNSGKVKGTGLGLSIVRHAVEAHGLCIRAESSPHIRTAFIIEAPKA